MKHKLIFNFCIQLVCALGLISMGILLLLQTAPFNLETAAVLLTAIIGALGVSIGYTAKQKVNLPTDQVRKME